jgi:glucose-1-phosphate thymidylyltransferase
MLSARQIKPSPRGELEIVTLPESYLAEGALNVETMGRDYAWLNTGTHGSLLDAANFARTLQNRQGMQTGCPEEVAYGAGWIDDTELTALADLYAKTDYGAYLRGLI